jgi:hypothetical protein
MNFYNNQKVSGRTKGIVSTLLFSLIILFFFFSPILKNPNAYYFSIGDDGLQTYFQVLYHTKYDSSLLRQQSINYPYGESIFFTGCMPAITNTIVILKPIIDLSDYMVGIINLLMLLSIPASALFIFLLFDQLKIQWLYGALCATGIAFLSPQIDRLGGHLALTFQFALPAYLYLLYRFYKNPTFKKSLVIGIFIFLLASQHLYFWGFTGLTGAVFFFILFVKRDLIGIGKIKLLLHAFIQIILPYLTLQLILFCSDSVSDRTKFPWGFLIFKSNSSSIFYPSGKWYEEFFHLVISPLNYEWEGRAYVGLVTLIILSALILLLIKNLIIKKKIIFTGNPFWDILFIASLVALIFSAGFPFIYFEDLLKYSGPIKQLRGVGRFSWMFFYVVNIISFYLLFHWTKNIQLPLRLIIYGLSIALIFSDAYPNVDIIKSMITQKIPELEDRENVLPQNQWIKNINPDDYQAILPLPYFHVGSENIDMGSKAKISSYSFITSLKTGLPLYAVSASRTSLSQTYKNIALVIDNSTLPELPPLLPNKPFLVICIKDELNEEELLIYNKSTFLYKSEKYEVRKFYSEALKEIYAERKAKILSEYNSAGPTPADSLQYILMTFDNFPNKKTFRGSGALEFRPDKEQTVYNSTLPFSDTSRSFCVSFWMYNYKKDVYPRTILEVSQMESNGHEYYLSSTNPMHGLKQFNGDWVLTEFNFTLGKRSDIVRIFLYNRDLKPDDTIIIDNLMIKPARLNVYSSDSLYISKNNRYYLK